MTKFALKPFITQTDFVPQALDPNTAEDAKATNKGSRHAVKFVCPLLKCNANY